jgi:TPR repeat protein
MQLRLLAGLAVAAACLVAPALAAAAPKDEAAVRAMIEAARGGSNVALIELEQMRRAGAVNAPRLADIVAIEKARAENGDPMTAWRLAQRYEFGDGVEVSHAEMLRWLRVVASAEAESYPKAKDAAFRLCEAYGRGERVVANETVARSWCRKAAGAGHAGAALIFARLGDTND